MIALIPLDDRPCNVRFPQQIAAIGGTDLMTPPTETLGRYNAAGQPDAIGDWLRGFHRVECLIVSIDMLAYGGLVASRRPEVTTEQALARLNVLKEWHLENPTVPIYAFNILRRLAITMDGDDAVDNYYNIMRYARLADEAERFNSEHLRAELEKVTAQISSTLLADYLASRKRNHSVNGCMIDWLAEGVFDYLLITQEDATEYGLHRQEQEVLLKYAAERDVMEKMSLHPGADEAALTLLARHWDTGVSFRVHWSNLEDAGRIAPFEDRPYDVALRQHIAAMRGQWQDERVARDDRAGRDNGEERAPDFELFVNAPVGGSQKDEDDGARTLRGARLLPFIQELIAATEGRIPVALCDVGFPNGADNVLMTELEKRGVLGKIAVFGGWNTAGNTTGTVLAQCAALKRSQGLKSKAQSEALSRQFTFERLVDDWYYQAQVRGRVEKSAREQGISPLNMNDQNGAPTEAALSVEALTRRELRGFAQLLAKRHFDVGIKNSEITLPWSRTFEADVRIRLS
jgi:hypothetical protein